MNSSIQIKEVVGCDLLVRHLIDRLHDLSLRCALVQTILRQRTLPQRNACGIKNCFTERFLADFIFFQIFLYFHLAFIPLWFNMTYWYE